MRLSAVRIFVTDLEAAKRFYGDVLGLTRGSDGTQYGYCIFASAGVNLILELVAPDAPEEERALVGRFSGLSFAVEDIAREHARLSSLGVVFSTPPQKQFWGGTIATFEDSSGNRLQLVQY
jgi:predicted enzyme related to lactoylglutathione lyase